ncbi:unnamed protein product, partial [Closterium sp. Naga37s-1]
GYSSTLPAGWAGTCPTTSDFACNKKIIGGGVFHAGFKSRYSDGLNLTLNWLSPRDSDGHGTWCAGAAAGNSGVSLPGWGTVSGVAAKARLAVYKVFWRMHNYDIRASETDIFAAVDRAVADGVDVLTLSLDDSYRGVSGNGNGTGPYFDDVPFLGALA